MTVTKISKRVQLQTYLASTASMLGMVGSASAGVINVDITNPDITGPNAGIALGQSKILNFWPVFSGDMPHSVNLYNDPANFIGLSSPSILEFAIGASGNATPTNFGTDSSIGPSVGSWGGAPWYTAFKVAYTESPDFGPNSFMGFRIDAGSGNYFYGYIEVTWDSATDTFEILSAAYESDHNVAIQTPSAPVPEPASSAIAAFLIGGTALRQWRKKRKDANAQSMAS